MKNPIRCLLLAATLGVSAPVFAEQTEQTRATNTQTALSAATSTKAQQPTSKPATQSTLDKEGEPAVVSQVDLTRYMGKWYEIANFPAFFQKDCVANVTADYALTADGDVTVINACDQSDGSRKVAEGLAKSVSDSNAKLKVSFLPKWLRWLPFGEGDYWILKLDDSYQTVLVGSPDCKYLWILARSPSVSAQTYQSYRQSAADMGYDVSKLKKTRQTRTE